MREIKFRAWNVITKTMIDLKKITPLALNMDTDGLFIPFSDGLPLIQYTGLLDKNGKEIYEGDIIEWGHQRFGLVKSRIEFIAGSFQHYPNVRGVNSGVLNGIICSCEIIGNIYENPELIS